MKKNIAYIHSKKDFSSLGSLFLLESSLKDYAKSLYGSSKFYTLIEFSDKYNPVKRISSILNLIKGLSVYDTLKSRRVVTQISKTILDLCYIQHEKDPWKYSSHDFTHSCRVQDIFKLLFNTVKPFKDALRIYFQHENFLNSNTLEYVNSEKIGQFCSEITCLLHDIGYPSQQARALQKSNHSIEGMCLIENLLENDFVSLFLSIGFTIKQSNFLINQIKKGVLCHGADKVDDSHNFTHELDCGCAILWIQKTDVRQLIESPFYLKKFSIKPARKAQVRFADVFSLYDNKLGIRFEQVDLIKDPINASIRFCDNLDTTCYRLKPDQRKFALDVLSLIEYKFNGLTKKILLETIDNSNDLLLDHYNLFCPEKNYELKQVKYFLGLLPIESISFDFMKEENKLNVIVVFNQFYKKLKSIYILNEFNKESKLVDFYFNRVKDSLSSITFNDKQILFEKKIIS